MLGNLWKPTFPLVWPTVLSIIGSCVSTGAGTGLHALGAAKRSVSAMIYGYALSVVLSLAGALTYGAEGTMIGTAVAAWIMALLFWFQFRKALRDYDGTPAEA
jgi:peptidoglycan biosynthesis protein MviN/MurJ (putative lipid II flippase)